MFDYINMGYWTVLPYRAVRHLPTLRLAPAGVIPQRERRPRPIIDYSYYGTNAASVPIAPLHAMQFGQTLQRVLQRLVYSNPVHGPPLMAKVDLSDGYYRVPLSATAALQLAVLIPADANADQSLIAIPLALPMGWNHSPPYFCAFTETVADLVNQPTTTTLIHTHPTLAHTQHHHDAQQQQHPQPIPVPPPTSNPLPPLEYVDVYMDDFIAIAQPPRHLPLMNKLLHAVDAVFLDPPHSNCRNIVSSNKIQKGDTIFSTRKQLLGWDIDTITMSLTLPAHRFASLTSLLDSILAKKRVSRRTWRRLLGSLRSTTPAIYGATHLFSILQYAMVDTT